MPGMYPHERFCDLAGVEIARFAAAVEGADPATPALTCGQWTLRKLIHHVGQIHRWAASMVAVCSPERHSRRAEEWPLPADPADYARWLADAETLLLPVLRAADPEAPMWAWGADRHARFWARRMTHETAVHRVDAELALGLDARVDPDVAVDGVGEFLENLPRARRFAPDVTTLRGDGEWIRLVATDRPDHWTITLRPDGFDWSSGESDGSPEPSVRGEAAVRAPVDDLYLGVWGRRPFADPRFDVAGDRELLAWWQRHSAI
jgi:uncharacterized protein (TIGR03083 family)